jgi:hypothetical protein
LLITTTDDDRTKAKATSSCCPRIHRHPQQKAKWFVSSALADCLNITIAKQRDNHMLFCLHRHDLRGAITLRRQAQNNSNGLPVNV